MSSIQPFQPVTHTVLRPAEQQPENVAVRHGTRVLTYTELAERLKSSAARIGRAASGSTKPEPVVAVMLPRGPELVTTLLGALHCGAVFLPVVSDLPEDRVARMLSVADVCVTSGSLRELPERIGLPVVDLSEAALDEAPQIPSVHPGQAAYALFTSGSTGTPKAVCVPHGALANHAAAVVTAYGLRPGDRVLQLTPIGFDVAFEEILPTLSIGAELVLAPHGVLSPQDLGALLAAERVTVANIATPYWQHWI